MSFFQLRERVKRDVRRGITAESRKGRKAPPLWIKTFRFLSSLPFLPAKYLRVLASPLNNFRISFFLGSGTAGLYIQFEIHLYKYVLPFLFRLCKHAFSSLELALDRRRNNDKHSCLSKSVAVFLPFLFPLFTLTVCSASDFLFAIFINKTYMNTFLKHLNSVKNQSMPGNDCHCSGASSVLLPSPLLPLLPSSLLSLLFVRFFQNATLFSVGSALFSRHFQN